jgi:hypothetical protein
MIPLARIFIILGLVFLILGGLIYFGGRIGLTFDRLPGNIRIERGNFTCVLALGASILLSILLTLILNLVVRILNK